MANRFTVGYLVIAMLEWEERSSQDHVMFDMRGEEKGGEKK